MGTLSKQLFLTETFKRWLLKTRRRESVLHMKVVKMMPQDVCFKSPISEAVGQRRTASKAKDPVL